MVGKLVVSLKYICQSSLMTQWLKTLVLSLLWLWLLCDEGSYLAQELPPSLGTAKMKGPLGLTCLGQCFNEVCIKNFFSVFINRALKLLNLQT